MSSEWDDFQLEDVADLNGGYAFKSEEYTETGHFVLRTVNITDDGRISPSGAVYVSPESAKKYERFQLQELDTLFVMVGATLGKTGLVTANDLPALLNQNMWVIRAKNGKVDPLYLHYAFKVLSKPLSSLASGSARGFVKRDDFRRMKIRLPELQNQKNISSLLGEIDSRITLLRETNATLEAIAQALFKSWFVDFDPVRAKADGKLLEGIDAATAELFPDAFEESELGMVPKGWVIGRLIDFAKLKGGKMLSKEHFSVDGEFPVYGGAGEMGRSNMSNAEGFVITVGRVGAYCGQYFWHSGKAWVNNNASHVIPHNVNYSVWLYQWLRSVDMDLIKKGAAQPFVSNGDIENLQIILPTASVIEEFVNVCEPLFKRMSSVLASISTLTNLRDSLLPRLITGQLRIAEAELEKATA